MVFIGIHGHAIALDRTTGQEIWRTKLKGDFVNLVLEDGNLYAAASGELYCLDPASGQIRWHNELRGLGFGLVSVASAGSQQTFVLKEKQQQDETAASTSPGIIA